MALVVGRSGLLSVVECANEGGVVHAPLIRILASIDVPVRRLKRLVLKVPGVSGVAFRVQGFGATCRTGVLGR